MSRFVVLLMFLIWWPQASRAAPSLAWRWSNPLPFGANISQLAYGLGLTVAVAERGQIFTSENLVYWEPRHSGTDRALRSVVFHGSRLVIGGESGTILYADSQDAFTSVDLGTDDWIEALATSTHLLVAAGDAGTIYTSADAHTWHRASTPFSTWLRGAAYGRGRFVVVGEGGFIATSPDGTNWSPRASTISDHLNRVVWIQNQFLAVGDNGRLLQSTTGTNWSIVQTGATGHLYDVAALETDSVVTGQMELRRKRSNAWNNEISAQSLPPWTYTSAVAEEPLLLIGGRSGMLLEGFQDMATFVWIQRSRPIRNWLWEMTSLPDFYVAVGHNGTLLTSGNGIDWDLELVPPSVTNTVFLGVGGTTNLLLAAGSDGSVLLSPHVPTNVVLTNLSGVLLTNESSTLGVIWHALTPRPTTEDLQGVAVFGETFILTGSQGTILTSTDGTNWIHQPTPTTQFLSGIASFPNGVVASGDRGTLLLSDDGLTWTARPTPTTNWIYRVRYLNDRLLAVGEGGILLTSDDGHTWTLRSSGSTQWLNDATWVDGTFYVVGTQGTVLASSNAIDWSSIPITTSKALYSAATRAGQLVVCGVEGAILRAQVRPRLTPARFERFARQDGYHLYLLSGAPDQRWTLENSEDHVQWDPGPTFEFLDSSGTLLLLQPRDPATEPAKEFFRTRLLDF